MMDGTLFVYVENPARPDIDGVSVFLPATKESAREALDKLQVKDPNAVNITEVYANSDDDCMNKLGYWLNHHIEQMDGTHSLDELNYLAVKIDGMVGDELDTFGAAIQSAQDISSVADILNLAENLDHFIWQPAFDAGMYGEFLISVAQDTTQVSFRALRYSEQHSDRALASYIEHLEQSVDHAAYARLVANVENGAFTDFGYIQRALDEMPSKYRGVEDIPHQHRLQKPSLMEMLKAGLEKSKAQLDASSAPKKSVDLEV